MNVVDKALLQFAFTILGVISSALVTFGGALAAGATLTADGAAAVNRWRVVILRRLQ